MKSNYLIETVNHINALVSGGMETEEVMELVMKIPPPYKENIAVNMVPVWLFIEGATAIAYILNRGPENIAKEVFDGTD